MGLPFDRASSAAEPAVEPTSMAPARRASLALFEPADCTHSTVTSSPSSASSHPWSLMMRLKGLYVAKSRVSVVSDHSEPSAGVPVEAPSPATQPVMAMADTATVAVSRVRRVRVLMMAFR